MASYKKPTNTDYTIYSISNCKYCVMAKEHLGRASVASGAKSPVIISCDKFVGSCRERDNFYNFMRQYTVIPYIHFPMIFKDGKFIGGLKELLEKAKPVKAKPKQPKPKPKPKPKKPI